MLHFVTPSVYPDPGGTQESALRIGRGLASQGFEVVIYTLRQPVHRRQLCDAHRGVRVVHLGAETDILLEPFDEAVAAGLLFEAEQARAEFLCLQNAVSERIREHSGRRHLLVSFYATSAGFIAQRVAATLGLPHIASFRGTDCARDVVSARNHAKVRVVAECATQVATTNREQAEALAATYNVRRPILTIHNSIVEIERPYWEPPRSNAVHFLSDCGFSGRKGTQLLLRAVRSLIEKGLALSLTILGGTSETDNQNYWEERRRECETQFPGRFHFPGQQPREALDEHLRAAHIYCSATISEGCSLSRIRALTLGIPIVTTRCGALPEVASGCPHVRLCAPGNWKEPAHELETAAMETRAGTLRVDRERVAEWRRHFAVDRERKEWRAAIEGAMS